MADAKARLEDLNDKLNAEVEKIEGEAGGVNQTQESVEGNPEPTGEGDSETTALESGGSGDKGLDYWKDRALVAEGRYNTTKGKLDDTIYSLRKQVRAYEGKIDKLEEELKSLKKGSSATSKLDSEDVRNLLGDEAAASIKEALEEQQREAEKVRNEAKADREATDKQTRFNSFISDVRKEVRDLDTLNHDPGFHAFLDGKKSPRGILYRDLFNSAVESMDADNVSSFFQEYINLLGTEEIKPTKNTAKKDTIASRIAPANTAADLSKETAQVSEYVSLAEINQFKQDLAKGKYRKRATEAKAFMDKIDKAYKEGRVRKS